MSFIVQHDTDLIMMIIQLAIPLRWWSGIAANRDYEIHLHKYRSIYYRSLGNEFLHWLKVNKR